MPRCSAAPLGPGAARGAVDPGAARSPPAPGTSSKSSARTTRSMPSPSSRQWWAAKTSHAAAPVQPARHVDAPQRPVPGQPLGGESPQGAPQCLRVAHRAGVEGPHVASRVEALVLDPGGPAARVARQALSQAGDRPQALRHPGHEVLDPQGRARGRPVEEQHLRRVPGDDLRLQGEDPGVLRTELLHAAPPSVTATLPEPCEPLGAWSPAGCGCRDPTILSPTRCLLEPLPRCPRARGSAQRRRRTARAGQSGPGPAPANRGATAITRPPARPGAWHDPAAHGAPRSFG